MLQGEPYRWKKTVLQTCLATFVDFKEVQQERDKVKVIVIGYTVQINRYFHRILKFKLKKLLYTKKNNKSIKHHHHHFSHTNQCQHRPVGACALSVQFASRCQG